MIDSWNVLSLLRELYAPQESDEMLLPLCEAAAKELSAMMKKDADPGDIRLLGAAAASANSRLMTRALFGNQSISSFKAGDVSVSLSDSEASIAAEKEKEEAMLRALPLLKDNSFYFGQVRI